MVAEETDWESIKRNLFVNYILHTVPLVVLYYDYLLTVGDEIQHYWPNRRRPLTWLSCLFLGVRYLAVIGYIPALVALVWGTDWQQGCGALQYYETFLELCLQVLVAALCILRVYALYAKDRRVLIGLILLAVVLLAVASYFFASKNIHSPSYFWSIAPSCGLSTPPERGARLAIAWSAVLIFDLSILFMTAVRAGRVWQAGRIVHVVLRDGVLYFCALSASNLVNIVTLRVATPLLRTTFGSLTNVLSVVLISRLMLNLRSDVNPGSDPFTEDTELTAVTSASLDTNILVKKSDVRVSP
ncbi:unnamed protein product [Peniophora sp. CBMAI 1063]|nr:unnamed protein product [Peniophora sp. CBMAI 1063]